MFDILYVVPRYSLAADLIGLNLIKEYRWTTRTGQLLDGRSFRVLVLEDLHLMAGLRFGTYVCLGCQPSTRQIHEIQARIQR